MATKIHTLWGGKHQSNLSVLAKKKRATIDNRALNMHTSNNSIQRRFHTKTMMPRTTIKNLVHSISTLTKLGGEKGKGIVKLTELFYYHALLIKRGHFLTDPFLYDIWYIS